MKKKLITVVALLLSVTMFAEHAYSVSASKVTSESIQEKEEQIAQAEEEREKLQASLTDAKEIKEKVREELKEHGIAHATLEIETSDEICESRHCHVEFESAAHAHHHHHH